MKDPQTKHLNTQARQILRGKRREQARRGLRDPLRIGGGSEAGVGSSQAPVSRGRPQALRPFLRRPLVLPDPRRAPRRPQSPGTDPATGNAPPPRPRPPFLLPFPPGPGSRPRIPGLACPPQPAGVARRRPRSPALAAVPSSSSWRCGAKEHTKGRGALPATPPPAPSTPFAGVGEASAHPKAPDAEGRDPHERKFPGTHRGSRRGGQSTQRQVPPAAR